MRLLLDTSALLWCLSSEERLGAKARAAIRDRANDVLVSAVSLWEIAIKARAGKLKADLRRIDVAARDAGFRRIDAITRQHLAALWDLPMHHRDPFDHLLIAQAIAEDATIATTDRLFAVYPAPCLDCRV